MLSPSWGQARSTIKACEPTPFPCSFQGPGRLHTPMMSVVALAVSTAAWSECLPLVFSHLGCQEFNSVGTRHWLSCSLRLEKISNPQLCPRCRISYGCWEAMALRGVGFLRCLVRSSGSSQQTGRLLFSIQDQNPLTNRGDRDCSPWLATYSLAHSRAVQCCRRRTGYFCT